MAQVRILSSSKFGNDIITEKLYNVKKDDEGLSAKHVHHQKYPNMASDAITAVTLLIAMIPMVSHIDGNQWWSAAGNQGGQSVSGRQDGAAFGIY